MIILQIYRLAACVLGNIQYRNRANQTKSKRKFQRFHSISTFYMILREIFFEPTFMRQPYRPDLYVGHHTSYEKAMRVAAGFAPMEDMLAELDTEEDDLQFAMTAYGLCVLLETHGETEKVDALREKLLARDGFWFCFSYRAAYSDHKYTVKPAAVK